MTIISFRIHTLLLWITACIIVTSNSQSLRGASESDTVYIDSFQSIESSVQPILQNDIGRHRVLQTNNCMQDLYGTGSQTLSCNAQDVKFLDVTGVTVYDTGAYQDENGIWRDACKGQDDYVTLAFTANLEVGATRYDVGMYINTEGGSSYTGTCALSLLSDNSYAAGEYDVINVVGGTVEIGELELDQPDSCPDVRETVSGSATLVDFAFQSLTLKCSDSDGEGLLDFDVAIAWDQSANTLPLCSPDSIDTWPVPGTTSKCWKATSRFNVPIEVPPYNTPSAQPSVSFEPSASPSESMQPSASPSVSAMPSDKPSVSQQPSVSPSESMAPSSQPSNLPSSTPSMQPSVSFMPSDYPSVSPSISQQPSNLPSSEPSWKPSNSPSSSPSDIPSLEPSFSPSDIPSSKPSVSPSVSQKPTLNTAEPSESPSISQQPSAAPSSTPSISPMPSDAPSTSPSASPSESPTGSLYYPDWINESQVCLNDGVDPEYMMQVQRDNYLYQSKEECCRNHFWWRIQQCMGNQGPRYYSNGSFCDQKVYFEDWESKFTPGSWDSSSQFETLRECCVAKFYYDVEGCIAASPKELTFSFSFMVNNIVEPTNCQDADIQGKAFETAINIGLGLNSISSVTGIGGATLSKDGDTYNTICGGTLSGSYLGDFDGTRDEAYYTSYVSLEIFVDVTTKNSDCQDAACFQSLYNSIITDFTTFISSGELNSEILSWAWRRVPPIPELWNVDVDTSSLTIDGSYNDPFNDPNGVIAATTLTLSGTLFVSGLPTITTTSEKQEAIEYFETAITDALSEQAVLLDGATVRVTGFSNGSVQYEIILSATSDADATTAVTNINTSLTQPNTLASITSTVQIESSRGSLSMATLSVNSNTAGSTTETEAIVATSTGHLITSVSTTGLSPTEVDEMKQFFEDAITEQLNADGVLPQGSFVTVNSIGTDGIVDYKITMYTDPNTDVGDLVLNIDNTLYLSSTLTTIQDSVISLSSGIVSAKTITASGSLTVTGLSITTSGELVEATTYFTKAIKGALEEQGTLPDGAIVSVTGFSNGYVEYDIAFSADSDSDAEASLSQINSSLSQSSTQALITDYAKLESSTGTLTLTSLSVDSNTAGTFTESTVSKVTSSGTFATSVSINGLSLSEVDEIIDIMEVALEEELFLQGALPDGAFATVTGIDSNGVVSYFITMYNDPATDSTSLISLVDTTLSQGTSRTAIANTVITDSSDLSVSASVTTVLSTLTISSYTAGETIGLQNTGNVATALSSLSVTGLIADETTGVPDLPWYPSFDADNNGCVNNGFESQYMNDNPEHYLFSSKKECCDRWFSYDPFCVTAASTKEKFYPDTSTNKCGIKEEKEFQSHEQDRFDTLEECCSARFPYAYDSCCNAPGLGGCELTGVVVYVPDWFNSNCLAKSETAISDHELAVTFSSASECCSAFFGWRLSDCIHQASR